MNNSQAQEKQEALEGFDKQEAIKEWEASKMLKLKEIEELLELPQNDNAEQQKELKNESDHIKNTLAVNEIIQALLKAAYRTIEEVFEKQNVSIEESTIKGIYKQTSGDAREFAERLTTHKPVRDYLNYLNKQFEDDEIYTELIKLSAARLFDQNAAGITDLLEIPKTKFPDEFITPKDKISNMLFSGELSQSLQHLQMEKSGNKELTAKVSIDFDQLKGVQLSNTAITPYDREVHDSIVSLYIEGGNRYITPLMIYRTITGNPNGKMTEKSFNDISESIERCSRTRVYIDASEEATGKGYKIEKPVLRENLIYTRSITGIHNGEAGEWIQILQPPVLYKYASGKNQVARMNINLLNTPVNKNEETIILQGYLQRRILAMKGSRLSHNILYDTVYKQINIDATSPGALRKKQTKIRDTIKNILDYWKSEKFIKGYKENTGARNSKTSLTIIL